MRIIIALSIVIACAASKKDASGIGPMVGILGLPATEHCDSIGVRVATQDTADPNSSCFTTVYERFVWAGGARAVGIPFDAADNAPEILKLLLENLNGFLFTGGGLDLRLNSPYVRTARVIYDYVLERAAAGETVPLYGNCMGMQLLGVLAARNESVLGFNYDAEKLSLPLTLTSAGRESGFLANAPPGVLNSFTTHPITTNLHHIGISPETFSNFPLLDRAFTVLSTNLDRKGRPFVSTMQHTAENSYIIATQWHPERPLFEWTDGFGINHTAHALTANSWFAVTFGLALRLNNRNALASRKSAAAVTTLSSYHMKRTQSDPFLNGFEVVIFPPPS